MARSLQCVSTWTSVHHSNSKRSIIHSFIAFRTILCYLQHSYEAPRIYHEQKEAIVEQLPPNVPRVVQDGNLEVRNGQLVPVLVQTSSHRLLVLNSTALNHMRPGQRMTLHIEQGDSMAIALEDIDHLALIARYTNINEPGS